MQYIRVEQDGPVKTITLTRGEKRNALNLAMLDEMTAAFRAEPRTRRTGHRPAGGGAESSAPASTWPSGWRNPAQARRIARSNGDAGRDGTRARCPSSAWCRATAIAGGCELALHCDFVVASDPARGSACRLAQIGLGADLVPGQEAGRGCRARWRAREILLLGDPHSRRPRCSSLAYHRPWCVRPTICLMREAQKVIDRLAANAPLSLAEGDEVACWCARWPFRGGNIDHDEIARQAGARSTRDSQDAKEGIRARSSKQASPLSSRASWG